MHQRHLFTVAGAARAWLAVKANWPASRFNSTDRVSSNT